jgi:tetratricopeptide (TPR) repeat protein
MKGCISLWLSILGVALCLDGETEKPVTLYKGLGTWHHFISTKSPEAQKFFDQGLSLFYSFNRYEALRSFRKASELDPSAAMTFWGMAIAQGPYVNMDGDPSFDQKQACTAVEAGSKLMNAPENERAYLKAAASWCPEYRPDAYIDAARQLAKAYPDDLDAQTLYADSLMIRSRWHWYDATGAPAPGMNEAETVLQDVIRRWPQHPGANHLYIHAVESSPSPERAIASAQRLMGIVPWAGHMVHMPGHIWLVLGEWETAATVNERAVAVDREYFDKTKVTGGTYEPYYWHNIHFVMYARIMQGKKKDALEAAKQLAAASSEMASAMPEMADAFTAVSIFTYVRFSDWDTILNMTAPEGKMAGTQAAYHYARAQALSARGDKIGATKEKEQFEQMRARISESALWVSNVNRAQDVMHVASEVLAARLSSTLEDAIVHWRKGVELQDHLPYDEPPAWYFPIRESLGACLLNAGKNEDALTVFREGVRRSPRNGRMLFGLLESLKAQGNRFETESVEREFKAAWAAADISLRIEDL